MKNLKTLFFALTWVLLFGSSPAWGGTSVTVAGWGKVSLGSNATSATTYPTGVTPASMTCSKSLSTAGGSTSKCYYNGSGAGAVVTISGLPNNYKISQITFYSRASQGGKINVSYSINGGTSYVTTNLSSSSISVSSTESQKTVTFSTATIVTNIKFSHTASSGSFYFGTVVVTGEAASTKTAVTLTAGDGGSVEAYSDNTYAEAKKITVTNNKFDVDQNSTVYFKANPQTGKEVDSWSGATADSGDKNKASLEVGTATEKTVSVSFKSSATCQSSITITKGTESNGTFTLSQTGTVCIDDGNATISVTNIQPAEHYHFDEITTSVSGSVDNENKQVTNISKSTTIAVVFTPDPTYTITFVDGVHNTTCTSFNMTDVYAGTQIVFNSIADKTPASPTGDCVNDHYHFVGWVESGVEPTENPSNVIAAGTTSINVTKTVTYKAVWAQEKEAE